MLRASTTSSTAGLLFPVPHPQQQTARHMPQPQLTRRPIARRRFRRRPQPRAPVDGRVVDARAAAGGLLLVVAQGKALRGLEQEPVGRWRRLPGFWVLAGRWIFVVLRGKETVQERL